MDIVVDVAIGKKTYVETIEIFELLAKQNKQNSHKPFRAQGKLEKIVV